MDDRIAVILHCHDSDQSLDLNVNEHKRTIFLLTKDELTSRTNRINEHDLLEYTISNESTSDLHINL